MWAALRSGDGKVICDAIESGARTVKDIGKIGAGIDCNKATRTIRVVIEHLGGEASPEKKASNRRT